MSVLVVGLSHKSAPVAVLERAAVSRIEVERTRRQIDATRVTRIAQEANLQVQQGKLAAGNGTAGRFAPSIFRSLGCELVELDCTADWNFPRYNPNPEDLAFLHNISEVTRAKQADLGIGIDGDGDRIGVVDDRGEEVFSDKLGLLVARWICPRHPGRSVVIEYRDAEGKLDRRAPLAAELVALKVDVILAAGGTLTPSPATCPSSSRPSSSW